METYVNFYQLLFDVLKIVINLLFKGQNELHLKKEEKKIDGKRDNILCIYGGKGNQLRHKFLHSPFR